MSDSYFLLHPDEVVDVVRQARGVGDAIDDVLMLAAGRLPHEGWNRFRALPYDEEVAAHLNFVVDLAHREPPKVPIDGLWFGLFHPIYDGHTTLDTYIHGGPHYDPQKEAWPCDLPWTPAGGYFRSGVLREVHRLCPDDSEFGSTAEYLVPLTYVCALARALGRRFADSTSRRVGVMAGWDSGDFLHVAYAGS